MLQIIRLKGKDSQLYRLLAPLVMDPKVIRANNNYPFKTDDHFMWFIGIENKEIAGFIPVEKKTGKKAVVNNYYVDSENEKRENILMDLLSAITDDLCAEGWVLDAVVLARDQEVFEKQSFSPLDQKWTRYVKMRK